MHIRLLGAHQGESRTTGFISILVDDVLAIDAGSLTSTLTFAEQARVTNILVTHQHLDHVKDLPMIAFNTLRSASIDVYCLPATQAALEAHIFNDDIWPRFQEIPSPEAPSVRFHSVTPGRDFVADAYTVRPVAIKHSVPTVGYAVRQGDHSFFFSSDTGGGCHDAWLQVRPDVLITETTLPDRLQAAADQFDHLTPAKLAHELRDFRALHGYLPRVIVVHVDPKHEPEVRGEIAAVARTLEATIEVGYEGMEVTL